MLPGEYRSAGCLPQQNLSCLQYLPYEEEAAHNTDAEVIAKLPKDWPSAGGIVVKDLYMRWAQPTLLWRLDSAMLDLGQRIPAAFHSAGSVMPASVLRFTLPAAALKSKVSARDAVGVAGLEL